MLCRCHRGSQAHPHPKAGGAKRECLHEHTSEDPGAVETHPLQPLASRRAPRAANLGSLLAVGYHLLLSFHFRCSWLAIHVSLAFPLVAGILFIPAVANLLLASFTDPGILHRGNRSMAQAPEGRFDLHWCQKCQYYCPPRTFHCPWCNVCVEEFDHHCKWLNNCIGCRNFRFFFLFVAFLCSYNVVVLASCITYLALNSHQAYGAEKICAILVTIPAALYLLPLLILVGSQASFITLAKHTYELKVRGGGSPAWDSGSVSSSWWW
uniref:Palmitoyltransferase n=1 Tax=Gopherus evgoodei TaxID=1825980 RepID=A0A8C4YED3_9SAUR